MPGPELQALMAELEVFGRGHDAATSEPVHRMLKIMRDPGEFLATRLSVPVA